MDNWVSIHDKSPHRALQPSPDSVAIIALWTEKYPSPAHAFEGMNGRHRTLAAEAAAHNLSLCRARRSLAPNFPQCAGRGGVSAATRYVQKPEVARAIESNDAHSEKLEQLNRHGPLRGNLAASHALIRQHPAFVARIAVALYDPATTRLSAYLHSGDDDPQSHCQTEIANAPSLKRILEQGRPRVINNMLTFEADAPEHAASYTPPVFSGGALLGFLFFNSRQADVFTETALTQLDVFGHLVSQMIVSELRLSRTGTPAAATTAQLTNVREAETDSHLNRMSRLARLIAQALAPLATTWRTPTSSAG